MKKILNITALGIIAALSLSSCKGFLEETNPTGIVDVSGTEALMESNVLGVHSTSFYSDHFFEKFDAAGGLWMYGKSSTALCTNDDYIGALVFTVYSNSSYNSDMFKRNYHTINRANAFLKDILPLSPLDEEYKNELAGEVRFYRAVAYFNLVRTWGDVPLLTAPCTVETANKLKRTKYDEIYKQIITDLEFASKNMRSPAKVREKTPTMARPNKFAPVAYLASVYLQIGNLLEHPDDNFWDPDKEGRKPDFSGIGVTKAQDAFNKSLEYAEKLIPGSPKYDSECEYRLLDKFGELFNFDRAAVWTKGYDVWTNPEQIFIYSTTPEANTCMWSRSTLPNYCPGTMNEKVPVSNTERTRPTRFGFQKWCQTYPGAKGTKTAKTQDIYVSSSDPRVDPTFYYTQFTNGNGAVVKPYPCTVTLGTTTTFPYLRKYWSSNFASTATDATMYYKRFAQVYLDAAEAAAYLGDHDLAKRYVEAVHARARHSVADGQPDAEQPDWKGRTFADNDELVTAIFWEKVFELYGEGAGIEYFETHNKGAQWLTDNIAKPLNDHVMLPEQKAMFSGAGKTNKMYAGAQRRIYLEDPVEMRKSLLCPLPQTEYNYNAGLTAENDFWWGK